MGRVCSLSDELKLTIDVLRKEGFSGGEISKVPSETIFMRLRSRKGREKRTKSRYGTY